jgi:hypothetical protein
MGLIAKQITKKKVEPVRVALVDSIDIPSWRATSRPTIAAIVRQSAFSLDLANKFSTVHRGRNNQLVAAVGSKETQLWLDDLGSSTLRVTLGAVAPNGARAVDWQCDVLVAEDHVTISTPKYLMRDGALAHAKLHDQFRRGVAEGVANWKSRPLGDSPDLSLRVLKTTRVPRSRVSASGGSDPFAIEMAKSVESLEDLIDNRMGFPIVEREHHRWVFGLGLRTGWEENHVQLEAAGTSNEECELNGQFVISPSGSLISRLISQHAAQKFWNALESELAAEDVVATFDPPVSLGGDG